jgi:hypothetical protein
MSSSGYSSGIREDVRSTYGRVEEKEGTQSGYTRPGTSTSGLTGFQGISSNLQGGVYQSGAGLQQSGISYGTNLQQSGTSYGTGSPSGTSGLYQSGTYGTGSSSGQSGTYQGGVFRGTTGTSQQPDSINQGGSRYTSSYGSTYKYEQGKDQKK